MVWAIRGHGAFTSGNSERYEPIRCGKQHIPQFRFSRRVREQLMVVLSCDCRVHLAVLGVDLQSKKGVTSICLVIKKSES